MSDCFWSQTNVTSSDIGFDVFFQAWLIVLLANQLTNFINPEMFIKWIIVVLADKLKIDNFWHIRNLLVLEHSVNLLPSFLQLSGSDFLRPRVCFL